MGQYTYRVLREIEAGVEVPEGATLYIDYGEHDGKTPDAAGLSAADQEGDYRAISARHFNHVPIVPQTGLMVGPRIAEAPEPEPAADPEAPCASEDCGHLPAEHGAGGLGICKVEGCPCGKYEPAS